MPKPKQTQQETVSACPPPPSGRATSDAGAVPCGVCLMAVMQGGPGPVGAHNPGLGGSTPPPATNQATGRMRPEESRKSLASALSPGEGCGAGPTRDASDASKSSVRRDGRERPARPRQVRGSQRSSDAPPGGTPGTFVLSAPAGVTHHPSPLLSSLPPAGAVSFATGAAK